MKQKEYNDTVHLKLIEGDIYQEENDALIQLTKGYKIPYFKVLTETKIGIFFEYGKDKYFYFDKNENYIYFIVNEDDITLLKAIKWENEKE